MDSTQKIVLANLKKKYGYYIAQNKDELGKLSDEDLLQSLLIYELDMKIVYSIADFASYWRKTGDEVNEAGAFVVLNNLFIKHIQQVVDLAHNLDPKLAEHLRDKAKESLCQTKS